MAHSLNYQPKDPSARPDHLILIGKFRSFSERCSAVAIVLEIAASPLLIFGGNDLHPIGVALWYVAIPAIALGLLTGLVGALQWPEIRRRAGLGIALNMAALMIWALLILLLQQNRYFW